MSRPKGDQRGRTVYVTPDPHTLARAVRKVGIVYALGAMVRRAWAEGA